MKWFENKMINVPAAELKMNRYIKTGRSITHLLLSVFLMIGLNTSAQTWTFPVSGRVTKAGKKLEGAVVALIKSGTQVNQAVTSSTGKFDFVLEPNADYIITVTKGGFITKRFSFNTQNVPEDRAKQGFGGVDLSEIEIFEIPKGVDVNELNNILGQPIAKFAYQPAVHDFNYDESYTQSIRSKLDKLADAQKKAEEEDKKKVDGEKITTEKYNSALSKADKAFASKDYSAAKTAYNEALGFKPDQVSIKNKLTEIDNIIAKDAADKAKAGKDKELNDKYIAVIAVADKALAAKDYNGAKASYSEGLGIKPTEKYPKDKIVEIDKALADIAAKASADKEKSAKESELNGKYLSAIAKGDKSLAVKDYAGAKAGYNEALSLKASEKYPKDKIAEIDKTLAEIAAKEAADKANAIKEKELNDKYLAAIAKGDKSFAAKDYPGAKLGYNESLTLKPSEKYPKDKIAEMDKLIADQAAKEATEKDKAAKDKELSEKYKATIDKADKAFTGKDYAASKSGYTEALSLKSTEKYPKDKLAEVDKILADIAAKESTDKLKAAKEKELNDKYNAAIDKADKAFATTDYTSAKASYTEAAGIKPTEKYPKDKLAEILKLLAEQTAKAANEKDMAAKEKENKVKYDAAIAKADKAFAANNYAAAKAGYTEAGGLKPSEKYPKDKLAEIDKIMAEAEAKVMNEKERAAKEKELNDKYIAAVTKGDKAFAVKDYLGAKAAYNEAVNLKLNEQYPKTKLAEIDKLMTMAANKETSEKEKAAKEKEINEKYALAMTRGNKALGIKDLDNAKTAYNEALTLKPFEQLPKDKLAEIQNMLASIEAEKTNAAKDMVLNDKYNAAIAAGDKAFAGKDYAVASVSYNAALGLKPVEKYPKDKLAEIEKIAADLAAKEAVLKQKAAKEEGVNSNYNAAIAKGDKAFASKSYAVAQAMYSEASGIKPNEKYPKDKMMEIERLLDEQNALEAEKLKLDKYKNLVDKADKQFNAKEYKAARLIYQDASGAKPAEKYPKDRITEIDGLLGKMKAVTADAITPPKDNDPEKKKQYINALVLKYPQGVTEEQLQEGNCKILRRVVVKGNNAATYKKSIWAWGGVFYFKDDVSITEASFNLESQ